MELFGVSVTTLEEVFLRVGRDHTEADVAADERLQQARPAPAGPVGARDGARDGGWKSGGEVAVENEHGNVTWMKIKAYIKHICLM